MKEKRREDGGGFGLLMVLTQNGRKRKSSSDRRPVPLENEKHASRQTCIDGCAYDAFTTKPKKLSPQTLIKYVPGQGRGPRKKERGGETNRVLANGCFHSIEIGESILHRTLTFFFSFVLFFFFVSVVFEHDGWRRMAHSTLVAHRDGRDWIGQARMWRRSRFVDIERKKTLSSIAYVPTLRLAYDKDAPSIYACVPAPKRMGHRIQRSCVAFHCTE